MEKEMIKDVVSLGVDVINDLRNDFHKSSELQESQNRNFEQQRAEAFKHVSNKDDAFKEMEKTNREQTAQQEKTKRVQIFALVAVVISLITGVVCASKSNPGGNDVGKS